jgi:hypothetical protein
MHVREIPLIIANHQIQKGLCRFVRLEPFVHPSLLGWCKSAPEEMPGRQAIGATLASLCCDRGLFPIGTPEGNKRNVAIGFGGNGKERN